MLLLPSTVTAWLPWPHSPSARLLAAEGLLVSPHMLRDHLCSRAFEALVAAAERSENGGLQLAGTVDARSSPGDGPAPHVTVRHQTHQERQRRQLEERRRQRAARKRWQQRFQQQRAGSLQQVLIEAS